MQTRRITDELDFHIGHMIVRGDPPDYINLLEEVRDRYKEEDFEAVEEILTRPLFPHYLISLINNIENSQKEVNE